MKPLRNVSLVMLLTLSLYGQGTLDSARLAASHLPDSWPMHNGDYSGRRFSPLSRLTAGNVNAMTLAWVHRANPGGRSGGWRRQCGIPDQVDAGCRQWRSLRHDSRSCLGDRCENRPGDLALHVALEGRLAYRKSGCRDSRQHGLCGNARTAISSRSTFAMAGSAGAERFAISNSSTTASTAPLIVKNHVIVGVSGDDLDIPGYLEARDPETGDLQWRWYTYPEPGTPEAKTWPNEEAMKHGGGMTWGSSTYDPELNLLYLGTGNPAARHQWTQASGRQSLHRVDRRAQSRTRESSCGTSSRRRTTRMTGMRIKHRSCSMERSTDSRENSSRRPAATAGSLCWIGRTARTSSRTEYVKTNWTKGLDAKGQPIPDPAKEPQIDGALVSPNQGGGANWPPPSFSPMHGIVLCECDARFQRVLPLRERE